MTGQIDDRAGRDAQLVQVGAVQQHDPPLVRDSPIAIAQTVNGGVELIVRADGHHEEMSRCEVVTRERVHGEMRFARRRRERSFARSVGQVEAARLADAVVVALETRHDFRDEVADAIVILGRPAPADAGPVAHRGFGEPGHDLRLGEQMPGRRRDATAGLVDDPHRIFDADELQSTRLAILFGPPQAGQDDRLPAGDQVRAVQLRADVHGESRRAQCRRRRLRVGRRGEEVAAHREEHLGATVPQCADRVHHVEPGLAGR